MTYEEQENRVMEMEVAIHTLSTLIGIKHTLLSKTADPNEKERLDQELTTLYAEKTSLSNPEVIEKINTVYAAEVQKYVDEV